MAVLMSYRAMFPPTKRRRTATSVLSGDFDSRPSRDVLTSLLNGVPINKEVERNEELRREKRRKEKQKEKEREREKEKEKERERERKLARPDARPPAKLSVPPVASTSAVVASGPSSVKISAPVARPATSSFWQARPTIHISSVPRSVSVTPPPMVSSPPTTPGPSTSSTISGASSKRPHTPYDDDDDDDDDDLHSRDRSETSQTPPLMQPQRSRKKRTAVRKGWKGWVEGSPPPSQKLINLDVVTILPQRKTRSGKSFDAIGLGEDSWV